MKHRLSFAITVLIAAMLACWAYNPRIAGDLKRVKILSLAVVPPSGSGSFTLEVTYETGNYPDLIYCNYATPDFATMGIGHIKIEYGKPVTLTEMMPFSITQVDGVTKPGTYVAGCGSKDGGTLSTTFTVTGTEATVSATSMANTETLSSITPTAESLQPIQIKSAGQKTTSNWDFQPNYCTTTADLVLTITEDGWGTLEITGDAFYDHINCLAGIGWEKWFITGAANVENETVSFMSCSYGDTAGNEFNAQGTISYSGGVSSGEVTCLGKDGSEAGRVVAIIKAP